MKILIIERQTDNLKIEQFNIYSALIRTVHRNGIVLGSLHYPRSVNNNLLKEHADCSSINNEKTERGI